MTPVYVDISNVVRWVNNNLLQSELNDSFFDKYTPVVAPPFELACFKVAREQQVDVRMLEYDSVDRTWRSRPDHILPGIPDDTKWLLNLLFTFKGIRCMESHIPVSETGKGHFSPFHAHFITKMNDYDLMYGQMLRLSIYCCVAISFLHCKNIELIDQPLTRQQKRKLERKDGIRYKTLVIEPFKKQVRNEVRGTGENEIQRALHICRGHFATYSEERPLFGKYSGTFWKPMHVRGNKEAGQVIKDYKVIGDDK